MRYNVLFERLQNLIKYKPSQSEIGKILGLAQTAVSGRANRNSNFTDEEIEKLEKHYNVNLTLEGGITNAKFYPVNVSDIVEIPYWEGLPDDLKISNLNCVTVEKSFTETHWHIKPEDLRIVTMVGNKMSNYWYKINDNDVLIIDTSHNFIRGNGVYFATSRNDTRFWIREMQVLYNDDVEFKGFAPSGNTTRVLNKKQLEEVDFKIIGKVIKNVSFRL